MAQRHITDVLEDLARDLHAERLAAQYQLGQLDSKYRELVKYVADYANQAIEKAHYAMNLLRSYGLAREADWLGKAKYKLAGLGEEVREYEGRFREPGKADDLLEKIYHGIQVIARRLEAGVTTGKPNNPHAFATAVILILATIGLGSLFYVSNETTARAVSPAVANLPLGISFLAILVIGIIMLPHRKSV